MNKVPPIRVNVVLAELTFPIRVEGDSSLAAWVRETYPISRDGRGAAPVHVSWNPGRGILRHDGRLIKRARSREELLQFVEWHLAGEAIRRWRPRAFLLHGAWIARGRDGVLLAGAHGFGKTTLAVAMALRHRWRLLGDDVVIVKPGGTVRPLDRPVRLKPGIASALPEVRRLPVGFGPWKAGWPLLVPLRAFRRSSGPAPRPRAIVILGPSGPSEPIVRRLGEGEAVARLARFVMNFRDRPAEALERLASLARRASVFHLEGGSLARRCAAVETFVSGRAS
ncbi:MAG: hypothetical protein HYY16_05540 [Planctomycetes bacterium]|nr:hypothetical protein [Planctomycetota bacterium]